MDYIAYKKPSFKKLTCKNELNYFVIMKTFHKCVDIGRVHRHKEQAWLRNLLQLQVRRQGRV